MLRLHAASSGRTKSNQQQWTGALSYQQHLAWHKCRVLGSIKVCWTGMSAQKETYYHNATTCGLWGMCEMLQARLVLRCWALAPAQWAPGLSRKAVREGKNHQPSAW